MNWVQTGDLTVAYRWHGQGERVLVLLHGMAVDGRMWQPQLEALGQHCRLLVPDLRGHGHTQSGNPSSGKRYSMELLADDLHVLLGALEVRQPALLGASLGGMVALTYAAKYGNVQAVAAAGAAASATLTWADKWQTYTLGWSLAPSVRLMGAAGVTDMMFAAGRMLRGPQWVGAHAEVADYVRGTMRRMDTGELARMYSLLLRYRGADWSRVSAPTLLLVGEHESRSVHTHGQHLAENIVEGRFAVIPGGGHVVNMEAPEAFNQAVLDFLREAL